MQARAMGFYCSSQGWVDCFTESTLASSPAPCPIWNRRPRWHGAERAAAEFIVAAVLLGSVLSSLFAGALAD
jgi:hypothetical protein